MPKDFREMERSNRSANPYIRRLSSPERRIFVRGSMAAAVSGVLAPLLAGCAGSGAGGPLIGFKGVPVSMADAITVPEGYVATPMFAWGEPVGVPGNMPAFRPDASNSAADQEVQMGMHHDALAYFPLEGSRRGLLVMNHEYTDDGLLHTDGTRTWSAEKTRKSIAAHGVSVIEIEESGGRWSMVRPSRYARRITAGTPMRISGPAAGHAMMRTAADPGGTRSLGTLNNCAAGPTPWGTYLTGEENFAFYFKGPGQPDAHQRRWGITPKGRNYRWDEHEERFDAVKHPNEFNRFGWIVEIDPMDPTSTPVKRTAMGRAAHEGAWTAQTRDGRVVVYMGEDAAFEYIYKFVSRDPVKPGGFAANRELLDHGTLYVARFDANGTGQWLEMKAGAGPLTPERGFASQGDVVIKSRQAADLLAATKMDRPEWTAVDTRTGEVYCTLTNNMARGATGRPGVDAANPRTRNVMGQIIKWKEAGDFDGRTFTWSHYVLAGDPQNERADAKGNIKGDIYGCPDGIWFDARGVLWIQTDAHATVMYKGEFERLGSNVMLASDPSTGETRRFLVGPPNCEVTGVMCTPDLRTMFVNIQHPGETPTDRSDPDNPSRYSSWPDGKPGSRPRSATVIVRRKDGGIVGT